MASTARTENHSNAPADNPPSCMAVTGDETQRPSDHSAAHLEHRPRRMACHPRATRRQRVEWRRMREHRRQVHRIPSRPVRAVRMPTHTDRRLLEDDPCGETALSAPQHQRCIHVPRTQNRRSVEAQEGTAKVHTNNQLRTLSSLSESDSRQLRPN